MLSVVNQQRNSLTHQQHQTKLSVSGLFFSNFHFCMTLHAFQQHLQLQEQSNTRLAGKCPGYVCHHGLLWARPSAKSSKTSMIEQEKMVEALLKQSKHYHSAHFRKKDPAVVMDECSSHWQAPRTSETAAPSSTGVLTCKNRASRIQ